MPSIQEKRKILYVEDNEDNIYMLSNRLRRRGFDVVVARNGSEGVAMAHSEAPALIVMDLILPLLDGWEATRRIKGDPATASIPIIVVSARAMAGDREKAFAAGCDDFDAKPVQFERLMKKIDRLLGDHEPA